MGITTPPLAFLHPPAGSEAEEIKWLEGAAHVLCCEIIVPGKHES